LGRAQGERQDGENAEERPTFNVFHMLLVCCSGSEFLGDAHPERPALETSLGKILIEAVEVERQDPRKLGQTELAAHGMGLVAGCAPCAAAIAGNLPRVITGQDRLQADERLTSVPFLL